MKVILLVDCQNDFFPNGALAVPGSGGIRTTLEKITKLAKDEKIPILKTMDCHTINDKEFSVFPPHCIEETEGQASIIETAANSAVIFNKATYNIFDKELGSPDFEKWLTSNKVTECWVAGVATDYCVKAAVLGLRKLGITTYVFENAIAGVTPETTEAAIKEMRAAGAMFCKARL